MSGPAAIATGDVARVVLLVALAAVSLRAVVTIARRVVRRHHSAFIRALARRAAPATSIPEGRAELDRLVRGARVSAGDVHFRLRPVLQEIAEQRLSARGVDLERDPVAARGLLGDALFDVVRVDREPPPDRWARVRLPLPELARWVDRLEML